MKRILLLAALMTACGTEAGKTGPAALTPSAASQDGKNGAQGAKGEKGDVGPQGPQGPQGSQGEKGDRGDKGDAGAQGVAGADGATGATGAAGAAGFTLNVANHGGTVIGQFVGIDRTGAYMVVSGTLRFTVQPEGFDIGHEYAYYANTGCTGAVRSFDSQYEFTNAVIMPDGSGARFTGSDLGYFGYRSYFDGTTCQAYGGNNPHSWALTATTLPVIDRAEIQE